MTRLSHHAKSKVNRRRSQQALKKKALSRCPECGGPTLAHKACPQCGAYRKSPKKKAK